MIKKNIQILVNNKISLFVLFLGPILLILLMSTLYYNENNFNFQIGIVNQNENYLSSNITNQFEKNGFVVTNYENENECKLALKQDSTQSCILFANNFSLNGNSKINVILDNSKTQVNQIVESILKTSLNSGKYDISYNLINEIISQLTNLDNLLIDIRNSNNLTNENLNLIEKTLNDINLLSSKASLSFNLDALNVDDLQEKIDNVKNEKQKLVNDSIELLNSGLNDTSELETLISDSNLSSSEKGDFDDLRLSIEGNLGSSKTKINSYQGSKYYIDSLDSDISEVSEKLGSIDEKLKNSLGAQKSHVENSSNKIEILRDQILTIDQDINKSLSNSNLIQTKDPSKILSPIEIEYTESIELKNSKLVSLFPIVFSTLILILALFLGSILSFKEKMSQSKIRNILASISSNKIIVSQIVAVVSLIYIQLLIIACAFYIFFINSFYIDLAIILLLILLFLITFVSIGILIGQSVKSFTSLFSSLLCILFLFFLTSGLILPLDLLSANLVYFLELINPYFAMQEVLRKVLLLSVNFSVILKQILIISIFFVLTLLLNLAINSFQNKGFLFEEYFKFKSTKLKAFKLKFKEVTKKN